MTNYYFLTQCCECSSVRIQGQWYPRDIAKEELEAPGVRITHGYCPPCFDAAMREIEKTSPVREAQQEGIKRIMDRTERRKKDTQLTSA